MIDNISVNGVIYWLPANNQEVIDLVEQAHQKKEVICLRGAAHSFPIIGNLENQAHDGRKYRFMMLSKMDKVEINPSSGIATVQAGCHLGKDPFDPTGISYKENSFLYQIDKAGWALSDLGGIIHQTIGGFMSTGSSGGSTRYSFDDPLLSIDIVQIKDNKARLVTYNRPKDDNPDDPFFGIAVSMGLMGVIVGITVQCDPKFYITGSEAIKKTETVVDEDIDVFGEGTPSKPSLQTFLRETEFTRLMWWPQAGVNKLVVWKAKKANESDAEEYASKAWEKEDPDNKNPPKLKPYHEVPYIGGSPAPATLGADFLYSGIGQWPNWVVKLLGNSSLSQAIQIIVNTSFFPLILPQILDVFVALDKDKEIPGPQNFADIGWEGLPMDNQMSDKLFPVKFTELWIKIEHSMEVMKTLHDFYAEGSQNTGAFSCEIYAAKKSDCWMSPAYQTDVIRIDVFWFGNDLGDPTVFYQKFWDLLAPFDFRPHWGKYLPKEINIKQNEKETIPGYTYLEQRYPKWHDWMNLRSKVDPEQVFVNEYWREHLGIKWKEDLKIFSE